MLVKEVGRLCEEKRKQCQIKVGVFTTSLRWVLTRRRGPCTRRRGPCTRRGPSNRRGPCTTRRGPFTRRRGP